MSTTDFTNISSVLTWQNQIDGATVRFNIDYTSGNDLGVLNYKTNTPNNTGIVGTVLAFTPNSAAQTFTLKYLQPGSQNTVNSSSTVTMQCFKIQTSTGINLTYQNSAISTDQTGTLTTFGFPVWNGSFNPTLCAYDGSNWNFFTADANGNIATNIINEPVQNQGNPGNCLQIFITTESPYVVAYDNIMSNTTNQAKCCITGGYSDNTSLLVCKDLISNNIIPSCATLMQTYCSTPSTAFILNTDANVAANTYQISNPCTQYCGPNGNTDCSNFLNTACAAQQASYTGTNFFANNPDCGCFLKTAGTTFCTDMQSRFTALGAPPPTCTQACNFPTCTNNAARALLPTTDLTCPSQVNCLQNVNLTNSGTINGALTLAQQEACGLNTSSGSATTTAPTTVAPIVTTSSPITISSISENLTKLFSNKTFIIGMFVAIAILIVLIYKKIQK